MSVYGGLIIACWVVFGAVWLVTALGAKKTLWRGRSLQSLYLRIGIIVVLIVLFQVPGFERAETGSAIMISNPIINSVGVLLCALGVAVAVWARMHLGKNWGMPMSLKENPELVTTGPYAYVRNPIYSGVLLAMLGSTLVAGLWWLVLLVPFAVYFVYSAKVEEKIMLQEFPDRYPGYKKGTKALVPFIW